MSALSIRQRFPKQTQINERMAVESAGVSRAALTRTIILVALFITILIVMRKKFLIWFSLIIVNIAVIGYFMNLQNQGINEMNREMLDEPGEVPLEGGIRKIYTRSSRRGRK